MTGFRVTPAMLRPDKSWGFDPDPPNFARGMAGSDAAASRWSEEEVAAVDDAIAELAERGDPFTTDDVWALIPEVPITKGIAGRLNRARHKGLIVNTGRLAIARRPSKVHNHAQRLSVWIGR
jgi:hypothetical protein